MDREEEALNSILNDIDGVEGRQVCSECGREVGGDEKLKEKDDNPLEEPGVKGGMKITIEPMTAEKAKEELSKVTDSPTDEEEDEGMPLIL
jgi:GTP-sensing pleiotropic transcriptional regulator CodY